MKILKNNSLKNTLSISSYSKVQEIDINDWNSVYSGSNIYLSLPYLESLETSLSQSVSFRYLILYDDKKKPAGIFSFQILDFIDKGISDAGTFCSISNKIKSKLISGDGIKVLLCGSAFSCGENGFEFKDKATEKKFNQDLPEIIESIGKFDEVTKNASLFLIKEFWQETKLPVIALSSGKYLKFNIDVNMILNIDSSWKSFEDYLESMTTKFRTKAKSVFNRSENLITKIFNASEIKKHAVEIEKLYAEVLDNADFTFGELNARTFENLKTKLGKEFFFDGYFLNENLVGFKAGIIHNGILDANYVGFNYKINKELGLYQRMLYDFIDSGIKNKCSEVRFGRTAEELKSSLGAEPVDMTLLLKHRNFISNHVIKPFIKAVAPSEFSLRRPFKAAYYKQLT